MNKYILLSILSIFFILVIPNVSADLSNNTFDAGEIVNYYVFCVEQNNSVCSAETDCQITALYPNTSTLAELQDMSYNESGFFNYTFGNLTVEGIYSTLVHCSNANEGVINSFFTVGDIEETQDEIFWLFVFLLLVPMFMCIIGWRIKDPIFMVIAGMVLCGSGFYFRDQGFSNLADPFIQEAVISVIVGIGLYLILIYAYKMIKGDKE